VSNGSNLEDKVEKIEDVGDELVELRADIKALQAKSTEIKARLVSVEDLVHEVENTKKILKMLNPKTIIATLAMVMGTSVGGSQVLERFTDNEAVINEKVEDQDDKVDMLLRRINQLEKEQGE
jgi:DNA repair exonuclease SbcCD ATPase subunit